MLPMVSATSVTEGIRVILTYVAEFLFFGILGLFIAVVFFVTQDVISENEAIEKAMKEREQQNNQTNRKDK